MKHLPSSRRILGSIEPLEARIAPAAVVVQSGDPGNPAGETNYNDTNPVEDAYFVSTDDPLNPGMVNMDDPIARAVGPGAYYLKMSTTGVNVLKIFGPTGFQPLISGDIQGNKGVTGNLIAFFVDDGDNEVEVEELTGIALGNNVTAIISGTVNGDVVSNYNDSTGTLGGAAEAPGVAQELLQNSIKRLLVSGNVNGNVMSGGQINNLTIGGTVNNIFAGTAANGAAYDFNGSLADGGDTLVFSVAAGAKGTSIVNSAIGNVGTIRAGDGGTAAKGGALTSTTLLADTDGFNLFAGRGGDGAAGKVNGGAGGLISTVIVNGLDLGGQDQTSDQILIRAGDGGTAATGGKGGAGGSAQKVYVGFESTTVRSVTPLADATRVEGGLGGAGKNGGAGGFLKLVSVFSSSAGAGNDLELIAGNGGAANEEIAASRGGVGGSLSLVNVLSSNFVEAGARDSTVTLKAGDGGTTVLNGGAGAGGGSILNATIVGFQSDVRAGNGSTGTKGGVGGNLTGVTFAEGPDGVRSENVVLNAGAGGIGTKTRGGNGGTIKSVALQGADLELLRVNVETPNAGDGGSSKVGAGAKGGAIIGLNVNDIDTSIPVDISNIGVVQLRSGNGGNGGDGTAGGGAGGAAGAISKVTIIGEQLDLLATGGSGGNALLKGSGGTGATISELTFQSRKLESGGPEVTAAVTAGTGGNAAGNGTGGAGGDVRKTNVVLGQGVQLLVGVESTRVDGGMAAITAGVGGNADAATGRAGRGGSVFGSAFASFAAGVSVTAGNAGTGFKSAAGGRIDAVALDVNTTLTLLAGNGVSGGAGGDIRNIGFSRAAEDFPLVDTDLNPVAPAGSAPLGSVNITAGNGSGAGSVAGKGGAISNVTGYIGLSGATNVTAGVGGAGVNRAAAGGGVTDLNFFGGGGTGVEVRVNAGSAADGAPAVKVGGLGGSVKGVGFGVLEFDTNQPDNPDNTFAIVPGTIIRHVAAGDGGDTSLTNGRGGLGGSVSFLDARADIGVRSGLGFGYTSAGGIFAGEGGINTTIAHTPESFDKKFDGKAGSVIRVTADAISAIVAGKLDVGSVVSIRNLATVVDKIILNGIQNETLVDVNGAYFNFDTANVLGSVVDPTDPGDPYPAPFFHANTFDPGEYGDTGTTNVGTFNVGDTITADTDGFVAAISFINKVRSARPEALLTVDAAGVPIFFDLNNLNGQEVVRP